MLLFDFLSSWFDSLSFFSVVVSVSQELLPATDRWENRYMRKWNVKLFDPRPPERTRGAIACVTSPYGCWCLAHKCTHIKLPELHSYLTASCNYLARSIRPMPKIDETSSKRSFYRHLPSACIVSRFHSCSSSHDIFWQFTRYVVKGVHRRNYNRNKTPITLHQTWDYKMRGWRTSDFEMSYCFTHLHSHTRHTFYLLKFFENASWYN